jgi:hypothetical protein
MLDHTPIEHTRWHIPVTTLFLEFTEAPQDDSFTAGETITHVGEVIPRIVVVPVRVSWRQTTSSLKPCCAAQ